MDFLRSKTICVKLLTENPFARTHPNQKAQGQRNGYINNPTDDRREEKT